MPDPVCDRVDRRCTPLDRDRQSRCDSGAGHTLILQRQCGELTVQTCCNTIPVWSRPMLLCMLPGVANLSNNMLDTETCWNPHQVVTACSISSLVRSTCATLCASALLHLRSLPKAQRVLGAIALSQPDVVGRVMTAAHTVWAGLAPSVTTTSWKDCTFCCAASAACSGTSAESIGMQAPDANGSYVIANTAARARTAVLAPWSLIRAQVVVCTVLPDNLNHTFQAPGWRNRTDYSAILVCATFQNRFCCSVLVTGSAGQAHLRINLVTLCHRRTCSNHQRG